MKEFIVFVNDGYDYEYKTIILASSVMKARDEWKRKAAPSESRDFRVTDKARLDAKNEDFKNAKGNAR